MNYSNLKKAVQPLQAEVDRATRSPRFSADWRKCVEEPYYEYVEDKDSEVIDIVYDAGQNPESPEYQLLLTPDGTRLALPSNHFTMEAVGDEGRCTVIVAVEGTALRALVLLSGVDWPQVALEIQNYGVGPFSEPKPTAVVLLDPYNKKFVADMNDPECGRTDKRDLEALKGTVLYLIFHLAYRNNCPAYRRFVVLPSGGEHKPVKWRKSREHYVYLESHTATLMQQEGRGHGKEAMERAAHSRRAHTRTLRDERYKRNADGSCRVVWVEQTWIGPVEFKADHKVYALR